MARSLAGRGLIKTSHSKQTSRPVRKPKTLWVRELSPGHLRLALVCSASASTLHGDEEEEEEQGGKDSMSGPGSGRSHSFPVQVSEEETEATEDEDRSIKRCVREAESILQKKVIAQLRASLKVAEAAIAEERAAHALTEEKLQRALQEIAAVVCASHCECCSPVYSVTLTDPTPPNHGNDEPTLLKKSQVTTSHRSCGSC